jgi:hypothetical protein
MGTTAEKLQAILNSKNAIKEKFELPDDMPFSQYAENIKGGGADYDINANIDSLNVELSQLTGKESVIANAEEIQDFNDELDTINNELSTIKGE